MWDDIFSGLFATVCYVGLSVAILLIGYVVTDLITPGNLSKLIHDERNVNATVIAASNTLAAGIVITMAIWTTHDDLDRGLLTTGAFGLVGVLLLAIADFLVDRLTPGDLARTVTDERFHPASAFLAVAHIVVGVLIAASIA